MRIGIDCRSILNPGQGEQAGVGHYTYYLVKHLLDIDSHNTYVLFFDHRMRDTRAFERRNVRIFHFPFYQYKKFLPLGYSHLLIAAVLLRERLDVFHAPSHYIPLTYTRPSVVTIHDLAIYKHPSWFPSGQQFSTKLLVPQSVKRAKRIIAVSEATKKMIHEIFHVPLHRIRKIYEGFDAETFPTEQEEKEVLNVYQLLEPFILFVGTLEPRKNIVRMIHAFDQLINTSSFSLKKLQFILTGTKGWKWKEIASTMEHAKFQSHIRYLGYVSHAHKLVLMRHASCFLWPTLLEGFGLPILEAMSLGTPVITSNISSHPEVAGSAAVLVNPLHVREMSRALQCVLTDKDLTSNLIREGKKQAQKFSWEQAALETLAVYREAAFSS